MITKVIQIDGSNFRICPDGDVCKVTTCYGKSADIKPVDGMLNADVFYEMDTKKTYLFDEETKTWLEQ